MPTKGYSRGEEEVFKPSGRAAENPLSRGRKSPAEARKSALLQPGINIPGSGDLKVRSVSEARWTRNLECIKQNTNHGDTESSKGHEEMNPEKGKGKRLSHRWSKMHTDKMQKADNTKLLLIKLRNHFVLEIICVHLCESVGRILHFSSYSSPCSPCLRGQYFPAAWVKSPPLYLHPAHPSAILR
jgi:hypothetical protein